MEACRVLKNNLKSFLNKHYRYGKMNGFKGKRMINILLTADKKGLKSKKIILSIHLPSSEL
ncbi:hypothetical protein EG346_18250 [Chryseobacterium carnipullorum]|uniref:Uncharacterized protein n=1 Tax=Chryseobacterium carnipullorum TaxID=1124835 RepID=A0A3G6NBQ0_CHRCU|nr:hypothetical protein EG346_18250 [Chryseobacterium carnipullorum]AZA64877.1 hypothetical protein EG345_09275 [Chryseobacterium carnipullorum]